jgi:tetratricopeptide (TPR) repeat protein
MTDEVQGRAKDLVATVSAQFLQYVGRPQDAEEAARTIIREGLENGRILHVHYASCLLADLLLNRQEFTESDATLRRAEELLDDSDDLRLLGPLRAHRARLLRLTGRRDDAVAMLQIAAQGIEDDVLSPEHLIWLVEQALVADDPDEARGHVDRLADLSRRTGVAVPPWERSLLDAAGLSLVAPE